MPAGRRLLCALLLVSASGSPIAADETLTVQVTMAFDRSITSATIATAAREEAAAIWRPYGVELAWSGPEVEAALHLHVIVARRDMTAPADRSTSVLGHTTIDQSGHVCGPIRISTDAIRRVLQQLHGGRPSLDEVEFARAIGRVLAHEVGHVLLGRPHDRNGLMRASFAAQDLAGADRRSFHLPVGALRALHALD